MTSSFQIAEALVAGASQGARRASEALLAGQHYDGFWREGLTAGTALEPDYILLQLWLHPPVDGKWEPPTRARIGRAARSILERQLPGGGFSIYPGGPAEISASVKAYCALKLAGIPRNDARLDRLRARILELGGLQAADTYVKVHLSLFHLYPREHVPSLPPEMVLAGGLIYEMSSWSRAIAVPLSIVQAQTSGRPVPAGFNLDELLLPGASPAPRREEGWLTWRNFFLALDRAVKLWERHGSRRLRKHALRKAEQWILRRTRYSHGLGAIYPSMICAIMALDALGYAPDHPDRIEAEARLDNLIVDAGGRFCVQPCFSPVWDTAMAAYSIGEAGAAPSALRRAGDWLLDREARRKGDWAVKRPNVEPSGWYLEFANEFYPDVDNTAMVLLALRHARASDPRRQKACERRAVNWLIQMQSRGGGWAAFDADNDSKALSRFPFAGHRLLLDPACPDITGRVIEALCACGVDPRSDAVRRGVEFLVRTQEHDGSWYGRWGVNYIYGTFLALRGLRAAGESSREAHLLRAGEWLRSIQNADGGWGESCAGYDNHTFTPAPSTASQTAWAVLGLLAGGDTNSISVQKGIEYLLETQRDDGAWDEEQATGTGCPGILYLTCQLYRNAFPLLALSTFVKARGNSRGDFQ